MDADYGAKPFLVGGKRGVPQKATNEEGGLVRPNVSPGQTIAPIAQPWIEEVIVTSEQCCLLQLPQQRDNLRIFRPLAGEFMSDLPKSNPPPPQLLPLTMNNVLIENV